MYKSGRYRSSIAFLGYAPPDTRVSTSNNAAIYPVFSTRIIVAVFDHGLQSRLYLHSMRIRVDCILDGYRDIVEGLLYH